MVVRCVNILVVILFNKSWCIYFMKLLLYLFLLKTYGVDALLRISTYSMMNLLIFSFCSCVLSWVEE